MKHSVLALFLIALLAGCASEPSQDAAIEDRSIPTRSVTGTPATADSGYILTRPIESRPGERSAVTGEGVVSTGTRTDGVASKPITETVVTRPLSESTPEVSSLDGTAIDGSAAGSTSSAEAAAEDERRERIGLPPVSPDNPLSEVLARRTILFDFDSSAIRDEFRALLEAHAEFLKSNPVSRVILQGHTDERGSREYNLALGQRRAESVYQALTLLGVGDGQMEAVSLGEEKPVAEGHDESAWRLNRRTEILYQGE